MPDPTALVIIRAWTEEGSSQPLRAHIRMTTNVANGFELEVTVVEIEAVSEAVEAWLRAVAGGRPP